MTAANDSILPSKLQQMILFCHQICILKCWPPNQIWRFLEICICDSIIRLALRRLDAAGQLAYTTYRSIERLPGRDRPRAAAGASKTTLDRPTCWTWLSSGEQPPYLHLVLDIVHKREKVQKANVWIIPQEHIAERINKNGLLGCVFLCCFKLEHWWILI